MFISISLEFLIGYVDQLLWGRWSTVELGQTVETDRR